MTTEHDPETDVVLGPEVSARRKTGMSLVAVRVSTALLRDIQAYGTEHGMTLSDVLRTGAEQLTRGRSERQAETRTYHFTSSVGADTGWQTRYGTGTARSEFDATATGGADLAGPVSQLAPTTRR